MRSEICTAFNSLQMSHHRAHALPTEALQAARSGPEAAEEAGGGDLDASILGKRGDLALWLHNLARDHHSLGEDGRACAWTIRAIQ